MGASFCRVVLFVVPLCHVVPFFVSWYRRGVLMLFLVSCLMLGIVGSWFLLRSSVLACVLSVSPWSILCRRSCHASFICPEGSRGFQCRKGSEVAHVPNLLENGQNKPGRACRTIPVLHSCSGLSLNPKLHAECLTAGSPGAPTKTLNTAPH